MKYKLGDLTVKHWNDWDRVARDPITLGTAIAGALSVTSVVGTYLVIGATFLVTTAITSWAVAALRLGRRERLSIRGMLPLPRSSFMVKSARAVWSHFTKALATRINSYIR